MGTLFTRPDRSNVTLNEMTGFSQKFVPRNADGTIFDCSAASATQLQIYSAALVTSHSVNYTMTISTASADATGITVTATVSDVTAAVTAALLGLTPMHYNVQATLGSDNVVCAEGSLTVDITT